MTPSERRTIEKLLGALDEMRDSIQKLLANSPQTHVQGPTQQVNHEKDLATLKALGRVDAERHLGEMTHRELGAIFVEAGGLGADRKKPKVWLIEQILWRTFDFDRGHEAIRGKSA